MSTKFFHFRGGADTALSGKTYVEGAPVEFSFVKQLALKVEAWHGISAVQQAAIITGLTTRGWTERELI